MGVTYKLRDEVVHFIIGQRQSNPLSSCRQLAELASQKFNLHLSKSSVHDVLKEHGIITPRGRKPKDKFEIPQEKKKQIQVSLSQIKLLPDPIESSGPPVVLNTPPDIVKVPSLIAEDSSFILPAPPLRGLKRGPESEAKDLEAPLDSSPLGLRMTGIEKTDGAGPACDGAGRIFFKAILWDLGIFPQKDEEQLSEQKQIDFPMLQETDWKYYLTYSKGIRVNLENKKDFFIEFPLPLERCIRETVDGLINNLIPFMVKKVSNEDLFKASMEAQQGFKIDNISIVDREDHVIFKFSDIVDIKRMYSLINRTFVESNENDFLERTRKIFFPQLIDINILTDNMVHLKGSESINPDNRIVNLSISDGYDHKILLQEAAEKLNSMYLRDGQNRLVSVKVDCKD